MTLKPQTGDPAAQWQAARMLYPVYAALAREFVIEVPECSDLENGVDAPSQESIEQAQRWLLGVDQQIQVHQLRQFLQTTTLASETALRGLLLHHLAKSAPSDSDRDKIDFLLVQFFSHGAPPQLDPAGANLAYVARALAPVLGAVDLTAPKWLHPLEELIAEANNCHSLNALFTSRAIEKGRNIKTSAGKNYFLPVAMVAFTRFGFLMRRVFFRLMHQDLNAILDGLRDLEQRGVATLDCRKAQFSAEEPVERLRMICQSWKVMFQAEYSSGQALAMLVDLRTVVDSALSKYSKSAAKPPTPAPVTAPVTAPAKSQAAAATGRARVQPATNAVPKSPAARVQEFEVSTAIPWDPDAAAK